MVLGSITIDPSSAFWPSLATVVSAFAVWAIRTFARGQKMKDALTLLADAARKGVGSAWGTYTSAMKAKAPNGKLTQEQCRQAFDAARSAALQTLGQEGQKLLQEALKDGWDQALKHAIESAYSDLRAAQSNA